MSKKTYRNIDDFRKSEYYKDASDPETMNRIRDEFDDKVNDAGGGFSNLIQNVKLLYEMVMDKGYNIPRNKMALIVAGLFYFIIPTDMVPDFLPFVGYVDDAAVITMIVSALAGLVENYRKTKEQRESKRPRHQ